MAIGRSSVMRLKLDIGEAGGLHGSVPERQSTERRRDARQSEYLLGRFKVVATGLGRSFELLGAYV